MNKVQDIFAIIEAGIENKYASINSHEVAEIIEIAISNAEAANDHATLISLLKPTDGPAQDINNQAIALYLATVFWPDVVNKPQRPIQQIQSALLGGGDTINFRTDDFVADFGGPVPTKWAEVKARLDELEIFTYYAANSYSEAPYWIQAGCLSYVFSSIIRIHPFQDGNGRTARICVNYLLSNWGCKLIPVPKVRNNPSWKNAVRMSLRQNYSDMNIFFEEGLT